MISLILKFVIGILIIPVAVAATTAFYSHILLVKVLSEHMRLFLLGITSYTVIHLFFYKPTTVYVFGHEAVHAITAWLFGGKVKSFKASKDGGAVQTDKTNIVIELSPYFVPLYAIVILAVYFVISASYRVEATYFIFLLGFTLAFHLISTIEILKIRQPDFVKSGYVFSIVLVYLVNVVIIALVFGAVFPEFEILKYFRSVLLGCRDVYIAIIKQLFF